jgi:hypothetical protein
LIYQTLWWEPETIAFLASSQAKKVRICFRVAPVCEF